MRAHSQELRHRVVRAVDEGTSRNEIIDQLHVSRATIKRYRHRNDARLAPCCLVPFLVAASVKGKALQAQLLSQLEAHPGATLAEHCQIGETEQGMHVSSATVRRAVLAVGWKRS